MIPLPLKFKIAITRHRYIQDSILYPAFFDGFSYYKRSLWIIQRFFLFTFINNTNNILSVRFRFLKNIKIKSHTALLAALRKWGWWETELQTLFTENIPKSKCFIDVGSMDGFYSVIALKLNEGCKIIAVEPSPGAEELIRENLKLNGYNFNENILFTGKKIGKLNDYETSTLSELAKEVKGSLFILVDIEGAEAEALESSREFLKNCKAFIVVETHSKELENECMNIFGELGYRAEIIRNAWWRTFLPEERRSDHNRWIFAKNIT